jgi:hypothetical protein
MVLFGDEVHTEEEAAETTSKTWKLLSRKHKDMDGWSWDLHLLGGHPQATTNRLV